MKRKIIVFVVALAILGMAAESSAKRFSSNGYQVELYWKVKGTELAMWGQVERGRSCKRLKVYARFENHRYDDASHAFLKTTIRKKHLPTSRSSFHDRYRIRSKRHKKGWYVDDLEISCSRVKPVR